MLTLKQEEKIIDKINEMSELELSALLSVIGKRLARDKMEHLIDEAFDIETYEAEYNDLKDELEIAKMDLQRANKKLQDIANLI